jgi:hypothetical protein
MAQAFRFERALPAVSARGERAAKLGSAIGILACNGILDRCGLALSVFRGGAMWAGLPARSGTRRHADSLNDAPPTLRRLRQIPWHQGNKQGIYRTDP